MPRSCDDRLTRATVACPVHSGATRSPPSSAAITNSSSFRQHAAAHSMPGPRRRRLQLQARVRGMGLERPRAEEDPQEVHERGRGEELESRRDRRGARRADA